MLPILALMGAPRGVIHPVPGESRRAKTTRSTIPAKDRILDVAYRRFSRQGVRAVGIDAIIAQAEVAKMTFYRHFPTKDALVMAFLERREQLWTFEWLEAEVRSRAAAPKKRLLAIFDVFDEWFRRADYEGCCFIKTMFERFESGDPVRQASSAYLEHVRLFVRDLAKEAGLSQPDDFASKWQLLMNGAIVAAAAGDKRTARRAREVGLLMMGPKATKPRRSRSVR